MVYECHLPPGARERSRSITSSTVGEPNGAAAAVPLSPDVIAWGESIVSTLGRVHAFLNALVSVPDRDGEALHVVASGSDALDDQGMPPAGPIIPLDGSVSGWVLQRRAPAIVADLARHQDQATESFPGIRSELAVPVLVEGQVVAVIAIQSRRVGAFGITDLERVRHLAREAAASLPAGLLPSAPPA
jgi:GAF domain-containing protein